LRASAQKTVPLESLQRQQPSRHACSFSFSPARLIGRTEESTTVESHLGPMFPSAMSQLCTAAVPPSIPLPFAPYHLRGIVTSPFVAFRFGKTHASP
jgi:hypothetical protein